MADLIGRVGPYCIDTEFELSPFEALLRAIVYQQLAGAAAAAQSLRTLGSVSLSGQLVFMACYRLCGLADRSTVAFNR
jgi:3-methyladenine DNA glycosylase/8-oxoguanine DNA glycosylase